VILADDRAFMRRALRTLLDGEEDVQVVAEADDLASLARCVNGWEPHVLVLDMSLPSEEGIAAIGQLREEMPQIQIVVLTVQDNPVFAQRAIGAGARGFVVKDIADTDLGKAVRVVARGEHYLSPPMAGELERFRRGLTQDRLTPREVEVLRLIALGHTSVEIAGKLRLSPRTVESHRARIHRKLELVTRAELVRYALGRGLLETGPSPN
jgi:two-component system response regulator NreC